MRPFLIRSRSLVKYLISIPLLIVIILNIQLISQIKEMNNFYSKSQVETNNENFMNNPRFERNSGDNKSRPNRGIVDVLVDNITTRPLLDTIKNLSNTEELKQKITYLNSNPQIRNKHFIEKFLKTEFITLTTSKISSNEYKSDNNQSIDLNITTTTTTTPKTTTVYQAPKFLVILIQVHSRLNYLKELINSLRDTKYIDQTLVIFSHDIYDEEMNTLVKSINFCATLQIFYPYSLQLYPEEFPGQDPNDCPKSIEKSKALQSKCNNAAYPDSFGNYREANVVQIKHHWFWKLGYVFEQLNETKNLENLHVLLLEEDHYLMPDSLHVLRKLTEKILSDIDVVSLAVFDRNKQNLDMNNLNKYAKAIWHTTNHNTGLLIARPQWRMIKDCSNAFCTYDDYNWDWTLQYLCQHCFKLPLVAIYPVSSRVIHIGACGTHHKGSNCDPKNNIDKLKQTYSTKKSEFFADKFDITTVNTGIHAIKKPNGGWSDPRDHQLCKNYFQDLSHLSPNKTIRI